MALYFEKSLKTLQESVIVHSSWHKISGILAICSASTNSEGIDGVVNLFTSEGDKKNNSALMQRSRQPTLCSWHPNRNLLAVGWENGEILIWNDHMQDLHQATSLHADTITALQWSSNGARLASGDKTGIFVIWHVDELGRAQHSPVCRLEVGGEITSCIAPFGSSNDVAMSQIENLAKAAVRGDEKALDHFSMFEDKSGSSKFRITMNPNEGLSFYFGSSNGEVYFVDSKGNTIQCLKTEAAIRKLLYFHAKDAVVCLTSDLKVILCCVNADGSAKELASAKLSGDGSCSELTWAGDGLLAAATSDSSLRLWDLNSEESYTLSLSIPQGFRPEECVTCVSYSNKKRKLAAGTNQCRIAMWSFTPTVKNSDNKWQLQPCITVEANALHLEWSHYQPILAVNTDQGVHLLTEQKINCAMSGRLIVSQTAPKQVFVQVIDVTSSMSPSHHVHDVSRSASPTQKDIHFKLNTNISITGIAASNETIAVWDGTSVEIYSIANESITPAGSFSSESTVNALHDESFFSVDKKNSSQIQVQNFKGIVKQVLQFQNNEGNVCIMDIHGNFLAAATSSGFLRIYDLSRRDVKPHCKTVNLSEFVLYSEHLSDIKCNCNGSKLAIIMKKHDNHMPDSKLYIYDVERNSVGHFDFTLGKKNESKEEDFSIEANEFPGSVSWDPEESRLLICEAQLTNESKKYHQNQNRISSSSMNSSASEPPSEFLIVSLFVTSDDGILIQDYFAKPQNTADLIGIKVPKFYYLKSMMNRNEKNDVGAEYKPICSTTMHDFVGIEECDDAIKLAMLDFCYYLTLGNMDEAFKAIKFIKSEVVWESMAKMCIKTKRVDVARVCLGRMGHVRAAYALRQAEKEPELDARVAMLALQLGMNKEAESLYLKSQRFDLLNKFYQSIGKWASAVQVAEQNDRIHLRKTYHNYGKYLEQSEDIAGAIPVYEKADTHRFEVPRMLFDDIDLLETYILKSSDKFFPHWWAQYMESTGEMELALKYYEQAGDTLSLIRVYCYCGNVEKAAMIANETGNRAACYHLARHFENNEDVKQAIHFYTRAATYGNAIRICKEHGFEDQLINLSLLSSPSNMIEAAAYYEEHPDTVDKAIMLYHKAGHFSKALKLAFDTQQFKTLELIAQELDENTDPLLLEKCANFFSQHELYDKAVQFLIIAKKYSEAVDLCLEYNIKLDETLVEKLTLDKNSKEYTAASREELLIKLADCCMQQGAYHLACKKYTQAGDKEKAMRALLKSGDTEKIMFFAGVSRSRNIYVMAANYLQSLDWRKDPEVMKAIINYYTKGKALHSLAGFYDACAQVEIDEYQNYDKALGALTEAFKCLSKAKMTNKQQQEEKVTEIKTRIALVKKFIQAKRLFDSDMSEGVKQCQILLAEKELDSAVRIGDVYGLLVENFARVENFEKAYRMVQEMKARIPSVNMAYYVNMRTIEAIHASLGIRMDLETDADKRLLDSNDDLGDVVAEEIYNNGDATAVDTFAFL